MRRIRRICFSLTIIASLVLASAAFAAPPAAKQDRSGIQQTGKTNSTATFLAVTDRTVDQVEQIVTLSGRSTYARSTCAPTFTPIRNTIDRLPPETPPPVS